MNQSYTLEIDEQGEIVFGNQTDEFVEVIFSIDGLDARTLQKISKDTKGYCYPPKYCKGVSKSKDGVALPISSTSKVSALIYEGEGELKDTNFETPAFIRRRLGSKAGFRRTSMVPVVIEAQMKTNVL